MKKLTAILLALCLCVGLCACGANSDSFVTPDSSDDTTERSNPASNEDLSTAPTLTIEDIVWNVEEGILEGDKYVLFGFTNNTKYAITELEIEFKAKENLSAEEKESFYTDMKGLWEYTDEEMERLRNEPISMWTRAENCYIVPGEKLNNIVVKYYQGSWEVSNIGHYNLLEPDIATIKYVDGDSLYTTYYDFTAKEFYPDDDVELAYYWTESALGDMIPRPESPVVMKDVDRDTLFSFDALNMTLEDVDNYAEQCKQLGFDVDVRGYEGFYAAHNADGYEVRVTHFEEWNMLSVSIVSPDN